MTDSLKDVAQSTARDLGKARVSEESSRKGREKLRSQVRYRGLTSNMRLMCNVQVECGGRRRSIRSGAHSLPLPRDLNQRQLRRVTRSPARHLGAGASETVASSMAIVSLLALHQPKRTEYSHISLHQHRQRFGSSPYFLRLSTSPSAPSDSPNQ